MLFIFDMGGVVTNTFTPQDLCNELKISVDDYKKILKSELWENFEKGFISSIEFWTEFNKNFKNPSEPDVTTDLFRLFFHPKKDLITCKLISELKMNHRVVCGTNTNQSHYENHLERGDYALFNQTYASNKIGRVKPNADFFELIIKAEGYENKINEVFFTDDKIENCQAAKKLGINTHHCKNSQLLFNEWIKYK